MNKKTQEEYDEFKLRVINFVTNNIKEHGKHDPKYCFGPTLFLKAFNKTNKIAPLPGELFSSQTGKDLAAEICRDMIKMSEASVMCFITEGYAASADAINVDPDNLPRPSQLPPDQRKEVLFLCFEGYKIDQYAICFIKEYNADTRTWKITPDNTFSPSKDELNKARMEGTFTNFYNI